METEKKEWWKKEIQRNNKKIIFINIIIYILVMLILLSFIFLGYIYVYLDKGGILGPFIISKALSKLLHLFFIFRGIFSLSVIVSILKLRFQKKSYYHSNAIEIVEGLKKVGTISNKCSQDMMDIISRNLSPCDALFTSKKQCDKLLEQAAEELARVCKNNIP